MRIQEFADEGARHDGALVDIERQPAHIDLVDEIGGRLSRRNASLDQVEDFLRLRRGDARMGKLLELVGMQMQRLGYQERGFGNGIGGAMGEDEFCFRKAAYGVADEIEQCLQLAGGDLRRLCCGSALLRYLLRTLRHQDLVQRAVAASSWLRASTQLEPRALSSCFQNGALVL